VTAAEQKNMWVALKSKETEMEEREFSLIPQKTMTHSDPFS